MFVLLLAPSSITEFSSICSTLWNNNEIIFIFFRLMLKIFHLVIVDDDAKKLPKSTLLFISKLSFRFFESEIHRWTYFWIRCEQQMEMRLNHDKIVPLPMFYHTQSFVPMDFSDSKCTVQIEFHRNTLIDRHCSRFLRLRNTLLCIRTLEHTFYHPNTNHSLIVFQHPQIVRRLLLM